MDAAAQERADGDEAAMGMTSSPSPKEGQEAPGFAGGRAVTSEGKVVLTAAVCTRERPELLRRALTSLVGQDEPLAEVLVIDNAPTSEATRELVAEEFPGVQYVRESVPGLDFARNTALRSANGDVVAFLDDDAVAEAGWAGSILARFRANPRLGVCTGRVEALRLETAGQKLFEANGGFSRGREPIRLPVDAVRRLHGLPAPIIAWTVSVGSGCSFAVRRAAALALGGFDEALDMGAELPGGGDHDMVWRMLRADYEVVYEPAAVAWHEHRPELAAAYDQIVGHQRALVAMLVKALLVARGGDRPPVAAYLAWRLVKPAVRLFRRAAGRDPLPGSVLLRMWWHCWRGLGAYPLARRRAARRRRDHALADGAAPTSLPWSR